MVVVVVVPSARRPERMWIAAVSGGVGGLIGALINGWKWRVCTELFLEVNLAVGSQFVG